jgi:hypothetical protein
MPTKISQQVIYHLYLTLDDLQILLKLKFMPGCISISFTCEHFCFVRVLKLLFGITTLVLR